MQSMAYAKCHPQKAYQVAWLCPHPEQWLPLQVKEDGKPRGGCILRITDGYPAVWVLADERFTKAVIPHGTVIHDACTVP